MPKMFINKGMTEKQEIMINLIYLLKMALLNNFLLLIETLSPPAHNLVTPGSDLIAKALHGEDGERLLKLGGELLDPEEEDRRERDGGDLGDVVPRPLEWIVHGERQEQEPGGEEAGGVTGVEEGHGRRQEALATPQGVLEDG